MSEMQPHINPWAEKLQQATLPDVGPAWTAMEALLDREMPVRARRDRRRWLLLILLLLLIIGICNCPGRGRLFGDRTWKGGNGWGVDRPVARGADSGVAVGGLANGGDSADQGGAAGNGLETGGDGRSPSRAGQPAKAPGQPAKAPGQPEMVPGQPEIVPGQPAMVPGQPPKAPAQPVLTASTARTNRPGTSTNRPGTTRNAPRAFGDGQRNTSGRKVVRSGLRQKPSGQDNARKIQVASDSARKQPPTLDSTRKKPAMPDSTRRKPVAKDSTRKKPPAPPKEDEDKETEKGFVAAVGFNQFFPVGGQQLSDFNSGGITGTLGDYLPVPMGRYYFNKKLYVQLEVQFNAPQYTKKDLVIKPAKPDTLGPGRVQSSTVSIKKLLYFNVPLSVHYAPIDGLSLGAGLQFSRLRNAFGSFDTTITNTNLVTPRDSVVGKRESTLKGSTVYQNISTNEFRFLIDVNYTYKHFVLGMRYNQALSNFIDVQVGAGNVTQSRNNSLQLYLRYILYDGRKKKPATSVSSK